MKKVLSFIMVLCMVASLLPAYAYPVQADLTTNYYVYNGKYTDWTGDPSDFDSADTDLVWTTLSADSTLDNGGVAENCNLYVLDGTVMYFGDLNLGTGGLYTHIDYVSSGGVKIYGGLLKAAAIDVADNLEFYMDGSPNVTISGSVDVVGEFDVNGGTFRAAQVHSSDDFWID
ncbi:MAG: hypothetical protein EOM51_09045 [Clostridia bacterium]|nr:hypothetical protein [Clostridia bacterium]